MQVAAVRAVWAASILVLAWAAMPAIAQDIPLDVPLHQDMRPMGAALGLERGPTAVGGIDAGLFCKKEAKKVEGKPRCLYVVNVSKYEMVGVQYSLKDDRAGEPIWSGNQISQEIRFRPNRWTAWILPKEWPCVVRFRFTFRMKDMRNLGEVFGQGNLCDETKLPVFEIGNPPHPMVYVEAGTADPPAKPQASKP